MTHEFSGHYAAKHPPGAEPDSRVADAVRASAKDGKLSCAAAHRIATDLAIHPSEVGKTMDMLEFRIIKCQLGLFGYGEKRKIVSPMTDPPEALRSAIEAAAEEGRLPCREAWEIAERFEVPKLRIGGACEGLGIKIKPCQLGAF